MLQLAFASETRKDVRHLKGKRALVTGAASGIGRAIALELARSGVHLHLLDIDGQALAGVIAEAAALGIEAAGEVCDLTQRPQISSALTGMRRRWGGLDILVNNAGVVYFGATHKMTQTQWDWVLGVNLLAPIQITHELLPALRAQPEAHILNVCSVAGLVAGPRFCAYDVSKFGLVGFSEALRAEYGRTNLGVSALCPGFVRTRIYEHGQSSRPDGKVPVPPRWLCTREEKVGRAAVKAIRRNRRQVVLSPLGHMLVNLKRFVPWLNDAVSAGIRMKRGLRRP